jgi:hypothetical protein
MYGSGVVYADWYAADYYSKSPDKNPEGPSAGNWRVLRGGSWYNSSEYCRVANRYYGNPSGSAADTTGCALLFQDHNTKGAGQGEVLPKGAPQRATKGKTDICKYRIAVENKKAQ